MYYIIYIQLLLNSGTQPFLYKYNNFYAKYPISIYSVILLTGKFKLPEAFDNKSQNAAAKRFFQLNLINYTDIRMTFEPSFIST